MQYIGEIERSNYRDAGLVGAQGIRIKELEQENARLREAARWIKTPEDPPNFDEWHLVAFQGAYYWVKNPPIIEHQAEAGSCATRRRITQP